MSARPASRDPSGPAAVTPAPADQDRRGSRRLLVAAELLRRGGDIDQVAAITRVPVALLELVRDEIGDQGTGKPDAVSTGGIRIPGERPGGQDERLGQQLERARRHQARARHAIIVLVITEIAAAASIVASVAALAWP